MHYQVWLITAKWESGCVPWTSAVCCLLRFALRWWIIRLVYMLGVLILILIPGDMGNFFFILHLNKQGWNSNWEHVLLNWVSKWKCIGETKSETQVLLWFSGKLRAHTHTSCFTMQKWETITCFTANQSDTMRFSLLHKVVLYICN